MLPPNLLAPTCLSSLLAHTSHSELSLPSPPSSMPSRAVRPIPFCGLCLRDCSETDGATVGVLSGAASVILMSHLGRPDGHKVEKFSLKPVVRRSKSKSFEPKSFEPKTFVDVVSLSRCLSAGQEARGAPQHARHLPQRLRRRRGREGCQGRQERTGLPPREPPIPRCRGG